ncbi:MAG: helix-turn-helix domain-containing protein [Lachnospiraceae bacterium]
MHRTSFSRRMNQIRRLTRLDLDNPDIVFLLQLSFRVKVRGES